jgi:hypothetical protein
MIYRYARVSIGGRREATQERQPRAAGAGNVFREVATGAKSDQAKLRGIGPGDLLMVTRLDRVHDPPATR